VPNSVAEREIAWLLPARGYHHLVLPEPATPLVTLRPDDQEAEVERLVHMGARPVDIGQHEVSWVVLADPEGKRVLRARLAESP
jgi:Glyoxalase-like domain